MLMKSRLRPRIALIDIQLRVLLKMIFKKCMQKIAQNDPNWFFKLLKSFFQCFSSQRQISYIADIKKQMKSSLHKDYFTPWGNEVDPSMEFMKLQPNTEKQIVKKEVNPRIERLRMKENKVEQGIIEDVAKKTLLDVGHQDKQQRLNHLKEYLKNRENSHMQGMMPYAHMDFKLPLINRTRRTLESKSARMHLNNSSTVLVNKIGVQNEEEQIFKKYGDHRKVLPKVERSISFGSGIIKSHVPYQLKRKYQTVDVSMDKNRQKSTSISPEIKYLKLRGKKYSYQMKQRSRKKLDDQFGYLPSQPSITPHHILFGHNQEDILKKVFKQIVHKLK